MKTDVFEVQCEYFEPGSPDEFRLSSVDDLEKLCKFCEKHNMRLEHNGIRSVRFWTHHQCLHSLS